MKFDAARMNEELHANWLRAVLFRREDPLVAYGGPIHQDTRGPLLLDLRLAAGKHTAGECVKGAFRLAGVPDPKRGVELWARVAYVCAPDLREVEALRGFRTAGEGAQAALVSAYQLGGLKAAYDFILECMTGGFP